MKLKPILFNTEMVRAILDDRKTVTRRVVPERVLDKYYDYDEWCNAVMPHDIPCTRIYEKEFFMQNAPYRPGDTLYVRETWQYAYDFDSNDQAIEETGRYLYAADDNNSAYAYWVMPDGTHRDRMPWRPSIHMPREAARIFLRVTDVRTERLQNITDKEIVAEGIRQGQYPEKRTMKWRHYQLVDFVKLWDSAIKPVDRARYGWDANPWVFVIEFERISRDEALQ